MLVITKKKRSLLNKRVLKFFQDCNIPLIVYAVTAGASCFFFLCTVLAKQYLFEGLFIHLFYEESAEVW